MQVPGAARVVAAAVMHLDELIFQGSLLRRWEAPQARSRRRPGLSSVPGQSRLEPDRLLESWTSSSGRVRASPGEPPGYLRTTGSAAARPGLRAQVDGWLVLGGGCTSVHALVLSGSATT